MASFVQVDTTSDLKEGTMKEVLAQGHEILLARVGGKYYAADKRCPHMRGNLAKGKLEGTVVTCPRHGSQFDLRDGRVVRWLKSPGLIATLSRILKPPRPLKVYNTKVEGDIILVEI